MADTDAPTAAPAGAPTDAPAPAATESAASAAMDEDIVQAADATDTEDGGDEPQPVRELTQTDHLNKRLLVSLFDSLQGKTASGMCSPTKRDPPRTTANGVAGPAGLAGPRYLGHVQGAEAGGP